MPIREDRRQVRLPGGPWVTLADLRADPDAAGLRVLPGPKPGTALLTGWRHGDIVTEYRHTIICRYCDAVIAPGPPRTPASAWQAPTADDPTACIPQAPGHAPEIETGPIWPDIHHGGY